MEHKISHGSNTKVLDEKAGIVEAFVNTMEVIDSDGDVISKDAFNKSFESLPIPVLASHDQTEVIGKVISAKNHDNKLHATMQMNLDPGWSGSLFQHRWGIRQGVVCGF